MYYHKHYLCFQGKNYCISKIVYAVFLIRALVAKNACCISYSCISGKKHNIRRIFKQIINGF